MERLKKFSALIIVFMFTLSLTGCGEIKNAERVVDNLFTAYKNNDFEKAQEYLVSEEESKPSDSNEGFTIEYDMLIKNLCEELDYQIISSEKMDRNTVNVNAVVISVDLTEIMGELMTVYAGYYIESLFSNTKYTNEEMGQKLEKKFRKLVLNTELDTVHTEVTIKVVKKNKEWKIASDDVFVSALLGGWSESMNN